MIVVIDKGNFLELYSNSQKKILEKTNGVLWNTTEEEHIAVNKGRYAKGDYVESEEPIDVEEEHEEEVREEK